MLQVAYEAACQALPAHIDTNSAPRSSPSPSSWPAWCSRSSRASTTAGWPRTSPTTPTSAPIGLKAVPHFTTFQKAAQRLLAAAPGRRMFDAVLERALKDRVRQRRVRLAAIDGTGLESRHVSRYFTKRQADGNPGGDRTYAHYPKVVFVADCSSHMILSAVPGRGPGTDLVQFGRAWSQAVAGPGSGRCWPTRTSTPSGCTARPLARRPDDHPAGAGPAVGQAARGPLAAGDEAEVRPTEAYVWTEVDVETVNSMIKRRLGSAVSRVRRQPLREITLRAITHHCLLI